MVMSKSPRAKSPATLKINARLNSRVVKHPNYGSEIPRLVAPVTGKKPLSPRQQPQPKPTSSKTKGTKRLPKKKKEISFPVSREECLEILDDAFEEINKNESKMYKMNAEEIIQAGTCTKLSQKVHSAEFLRTLTYGEVEPDAIADTILPLLDLKESDVFYDLGCGTGKIVMQVALQTRCKASKGIEIMFDRIEEGLKAFQRLEERYDEKLGRNRMTIVQGDISDPPACANLQDATVLFINNVCFGPALMHIVTDILTNYPNIHRVVTLRKICQRHSNRRCGMKGYACASFEHPPQETNVSVSWAHETSAFLYIRKQQE